jgi:hypothetical protein
MFCVCIQQSTCQGLNETILPRSTANPIRNSALKNAQDAPNTIDDIRTPKDPKGNILHQSTKEKAGYCNDNDT